MKQRVLEEPSLGLLEHFVPIQYLFYVLAVGSLVSGAATPSWEPGSSIHPCSAAPLNPLSD